MNKGSILFLFFKICTSGIITLAKPTRTILNRNGQDEYFDVFSDLNWLSGQFSPLSILAVAFGTCHFSD